MIRVAGNIVDDAILGSIEYAVEHLGTKLILVLGHEKCGAVTAAVEGGAAPGHLPAVVDAIRPVVAATADMPGDKSSQLRARERTARSPAGSRVRTRDEGGVVNKGLKVVAADYALDTEGRSRFSTIR